jgi:DNA-directed RNA polymerase subunit beta
MDEVVPRTHRTITKYDLVKLIERMILINNGLEKPDDIDHLGNRRVKTVGELIQNSLRIGLRRMERVVRERMSIRESDSLSPMTLINIRPVVASVREFFGSSQLSQFMEQTNPLSELTHKRTLSARPGGLASARLRRAMCITATTGAFVLLKHPKVQTLSDGTSALRAC